MVFVITYQVFSIELVSVRASQPSDTYFSAQHENSVSRHTHGDIHSSTQGFPHTEHEREPLLSNTIE